MNRREFFQKRGLARMLQKLQAAAEPKHMNVSVASAYVLLQMETISCTYCGRPSEVFRGPPLKVRRPMKWRPNDGTWGRINHMVRRGASPNELAAEMQRCTPVCQPCDKRRKA